MIKILKDISFNIDHSTGSHFIFYNPQTRERAVVSYHIKDLPKGALMSILGEVGMSRKEFEDLLK